MADLKTLQNAFMKAHNAGDTANAQILATEIKRQMATQAPTETAPQPAPIADYKPPTVSDLVNGMTPMGMASNIGDAVMHPMQSLQKVDDVVRRSANMLSGGYADKFAGYMNGTGMDAERARSASMDSRLGAAGPVVDVGSLALVGPAMVARGATFSAIPKVSALLGTTLDSAAYGALNAGGHDTNIGAGAIEGAGLGALGHAVGSGIGKIYNAFKGSPAMTEALNNAPSFASNKAAKNAVYSELQNAGIKFDADGFLKTLDNIDAGLKGYRPAKAPLTADTIDNLSQYVGKSPTFQEMEGMLQDAKEITREPLASNTDKKAAGIVVDHLNEFFNNGSLMTDGSIAADKVVSMAAKARELARRDIVSKHLNIMENKADWYKSGQESGLQNQVASYGKRSGESLTDAEYNAAQNVVKKEGIDNVLNQAGTRIAMHGASGVGTILGAMFGGPVGALVGAGATTAGNLLARKLSGNVTKNAFEKLQKTVLMGKSAQATATASDALTQIENQKRGALLSKLLATSLVPATQSKMGH